MSLPSLVSRFSFSSWLQLINRRVQILVRRDGLYGYQTQCLGHIGVCYPLVLVYFLTCIACINLTGRSAMAGIQQYSGDSPRSLGLENESIANDQAKFVRYAGRVLIYLSLK